MATQLAELELLARAPREHAVDWRFHVAMASGCVALFAVSMIVPVAMIVLACACMLPAILWHDRGRYAKRDAALILPWIAMMFGVTPTATARCEALGFPFRDVALARIDRALGLDVRAIVAWCAMHPRIDSLLTHAYYTLGWFLAGTIVFLVLAGRKIELERLMLANLFAFLISVPLCAVAPAIGAWVGYGFAPSAAQRSAELWVLGRQSPLITLPSFHVIWAILAASSLWYLRALRLPVAAFTALIVISTVTTGWHYAIDAFAGLLIAYISLWLVDKLLRSVLHARESHHGT